MKTSVATLTLSFLAAGALLLPDGAEAGRFGGEGRHVAAHAGAGARAGGHRNIARDRTVTRTRVTTSWRGGRARWNGGYYRGGRYYGGWGAAAAGAAIGAAATSAAYNTAAYSSNCYQQQSVWNGYSYVWQSVYVC